MERLTGRRFHEVKKAKKTSSNTATLVARLLQVTNNKALTEPLQVFSQREDNAGFVAKRGLTVRENITIRTISKHNMCIQHSVAWLPELNRLSVA